MSTATAPPETLVTEDLMELLHASRATIYRLVRAGKLPRPVVLGRRRLWRAAEIAAILEGRNASKES